MLVRNLGSVPLGSLHLLYMMLPEVIRLGPGDSLPVWPAYMAGNLVLAVSWELDWGGWSGSLVPFHKGLSIGFLSTWGCLVCLTRQWLYCKSECPKRQEVGASSFLWSGPGKLAHHYFCCILLVKMVTETTQI